MRENRTCGSEGGEAKAFPTPIMGSRHLHLPMDRFHVLADLAKNQCTQPEILIGNTTPPFSPPGGAHDSPTPVIARKPQATTRSRATGKKPSIASLPWGSSQ